MDPVDPSPSHCSRLLSQHNRRLGYLEIHFELTNFGRFFNSKKVANWILFEMNLNCLLCTFVDNRCITLEILIEFDFKKQLLMLSFCWFELHCDFHTVRKIDPMIDLSKSTLIDFLCKFEGLSNFNLHILLNLFFIPSLVCLYLTKIIGENLLFSFTVSVFINQTKLANQLR